MTTITTIHQIKEGDNYNATSHSLSQPHPKPPARKGAKIRKKESVLVTKGSIARWRKLKAISITQLVVECKPYILIGYATRGLLVIVIE